MISIYSIHPSHTSLKTFFDSMCIDCPPNVVWSAESPDILFASEFIHYKRDCYNQFRKLFNSSKVKVKVGGEAIYPDWNLFDYAVGFDNHHQNGDRFIRLLSPFDMFHKWIHSKENEIDTIEKARIELATKTLFCNFLYSNPNAHPMRDKLFFEISRYKKVDSLGCHLNNVEQEGTGFAGHRNDCVPLKSKYKFSIASENAAYPGYTSEKILTSLAAHNIPIYFGNPDICEDINPEAFINVNDFDSLDSLVNYIREVDNNDELWCKYVSSPWLTKEQEIYHKNRTADYKSHMYELLVSPQSRICIGTHSDLYREHFLTEKFPMDKTFTQKVMSRCHNLLGRIV